MFQTSFKIATENPEAFEIFRKQYILPQALDYSAGVISNRSRNNRPRGPSCKENRLRFFSKVSHKTKIQPLNAVL